MSRVAGMTDFNETKIRRDTSGKFADKENSRPEVTLLEQQALYLAGAAATVAHPRNGDQGAPPRIGTSIHAALEEHSRQ